MATGLSSRFALGLVAGLALACADPPGSADAGTGSDPGSSSGTEAGDSGDGDSGDGDGDLGDGDGDSGDGDGDSGDGDGDSGDGDGEPSACATDPRIPAQCGDGVVAAGELCLPGQPSFLDPAFGGIRGFAVADWTGDGRDDLIVQEAGGASHWERPPGVAVLSSHGGDVLYRLHQTPVRTGLTVLNHGVVIVDYDGDGDPDVVNVDVPGQQLRAARNEGLRGITSGGVTPLGGEPIARVRPFDFDADGREDVVVFGATTARVFTSDGDGGFTLAASLTPTLPPTVTHGPRFEVGDLDGDARPDIVAVAGDDGSSTTVAAFVRDGDGFVEHTSVIPRQLQDLNAVRVGDIDGDGDLDLVYLGATEDWRRIHVAWGDGTGAFVDHPTAWRFRADVGSPFFELADVDGDGLLDVVSFGDQRIRVQLATGDETIFGAFDEYVAVASEITAIGNRSWAIADFIGDDGLPDLLACGPETCRPGLNQGDGSFAPMDMFDLPWETNAGAIRPLDVGGDGQIDVAIVSGAGYGDRDELLILANDGGTFRSRRIDGWGSTALIAADFDADGDAELVSVIGLEEQLAIAHRRADGGVSWSTIFYDQNSIPSLVAMPRDLGGPVDLLKNHLMHLNSGDGVEFSTHMQVGLPFYSVERRFAFVDVNGDQDIDVVGFGSAQTANVIRVHEAIPGLGFADPIEFGIMAVACNGALPIEEIAGVDLDGDGVAEVVTTGTCGAISGSQLQTWRWNDGQSKFDPPVANFEIPGTWEGMQGRDLDLDGIGDLSFVDRAPVGDAVMVLFGGQRDDFDLAAQAVFGEDPGSDHISFYAGAGPHYAWGDFNGDCAIDLAVARVVGAGRQVAIYLAEP